VLLKMGDVRLHPIAVPFFPEVALSSTVRAIVVTLAVIGIVYGALVAMVQPDIKKLVAYSSVSHLGFVMLGIWAGTVQSLQGALMV
jgi:NADH-quinone oxidoreductase subunit M